MEWLDSRLNLSSVPFLRIVVPIIIGIILHEAGANVFISLIFLFSGIFIYILTMRNKRPNCQFKYNRLYSIALFLCLVFTGWLCAALNSPKEIDNSELFKSRFINYHVEHVTHKNITTDLSGYTNSIDGTPIPILLTIGGNNYHIQPGDILLCHTTIEPISNSTVPEAFDYASFMKNNGYLYRGFLKNEDYMQIGHSEDISIKALKIRNALIRQIMLTGLNDGTSNFIITILTGDSSYIAQETIETFKSAGLAHILAISGLHVSIIGMLIAFLLKPMQRLRLRNTRFIITLCLIWAFTFITGMSPSATRAAIMTSFLLVASISLKKYSFLNALCGAASLILIFDPCALFNIGFQLSFLSMLGILLFARKFTFGKKGSFLQFFTSIFAISVASQLGSFIILIYHFNSMQIGFLIGNIIVVPLLPIFVILSVCALMLSFFHLKFILLNIATNSLYDFFIFIAEIPQKIPHSTIDNLWIGTSSAILFYMAIILFGVFLHHKQRIQMIAYPIACVLLGIFISFVEKNSHASDGIFISDGYASTNIVYYTGKHAYIVNSMNDSSEISNFVSKNNRFFIKYRIDSIHPICHDYKSKDFFYTDPVVFAKGLKFVFAKGNIKKKYATDKPLLHTDYSIITNSYYNSISDLQAVFKSDTIIIPNEIYPAKRNVFVQDAEKLDIPTINVRTDGTFNYSF